MRLLLFSALIVCSIFYFYPGSESTEAPAVALTKTKTESEIPALTEVSPAIEKPEAIAETDAFHGTFWEEVRERWDIDFRELITRLEPEEVDEILSRYELAKKSFGVEVTRIIALQEKGDLHRDEVKRLFKVADEDYEKKLNHIFGDHYEEIKATLARFDEEIQDMNNEGDYEIGYTL